MLCRLLEPRNDRDRNHWLRRALIPRCMGKFSFPTCPEDLGKAELPTILRKSLRAED